MRHRATGRHRWVVVGLVLVAVGVVAALGLLAWAVMLATDMRDDMWVCRQTPSVVSCGWQR